MDCLADFGTGWGLKDGLAKIGELEELGRLYDFNICLLTEQEYGILQGISPLLAKNWAK